MKSKTGDKQRLFHILESCNKILLAVKDYNEEAFVNNFIITAAVCNFIMIIGEASSTITYDFKQGHKEFDWKLMKGMRNIIVHEYFGVDNYKMFETVVNDIPKLKNLCLIALKEIDNDAPAN